MGCGASNVSAADQTSPQGRTPAVVQSLPTPNKAPPTQYRPATSTAGYLAPPSPPLPPAAIPPPPCTYGQPVGGYAIPPPATAGFGPSRMPGVGGMPGYGGYCRGPGVYGPGFGNPPGERIVIVDRTPYDGVTAYEDVMIAGGIGLMGGMVMAEGMILAEEMMMPDGMMVTEVIQDDVWF